MAPKAWMLEREMRQGARPQQEGEALVEVAGAGGDSGPGTGGEARWKQAVEALSAPVRLARILWYSEVPGSGAPDRLVVGAIQSQENRGHDVTGAEALIEPAQEAYDRGNDLLLSRIIAEIYRELWQAPRVPGHPYHGFEHPDTWEAVEALLPRSAETGARVTPACDVTSAEYFDRVLAAWLGKNIGGALGTPLEGYTGRQIREVYGDVRGYVRPPSTINDDITYEIAFLKALDTHGPGLTSLQLAMHWLDLIPMGWSAELVALDNLRRGITPPESGRLLNPFSEWIGAQMRGEVCGLVAPGRPREAVRWAWLDGVISHEKNGVYAEMYNAALVSLAFVEPDIRSLLQSALNWVPPRSEFADVVRRTLAWCRTAETWKAAWAQAERAFERYHWIHAYPNAAAVIIGLWFGEGDFAETLHVTAMCGLDVDCNVGQALAIVGASRGTRVIPATLADPLADNLETYVAGFERMRISDLARWTVTLAGRLTGR